MSIIYSILTNTALCSLYYFTKKDVRSLRLGFGLFALATNLVELYFPLEAFFFEDMFDFFDGYAIRTSFFLFWILLFFLNLEKKYVEVSSTALLWVPFIALFRHEYIYINTFIFILFLSLLNTWDREKVSRNIHVLIILVTAIQFLLLDIGREEIGYDFESLVFSEIFRLTNINILTAIMALCIFTVMATEKENNSVCYFMKLSYPVFIIRMSQQVQFGEPLLIMSYLVIFLATVIIIPFGRFDMTLYLFVVSFAFTMDEQSSDLLPFYYIIAILVGETINFIEKKGRIPVKGIGCLCLLPVVNPFVTNIFSHLGSLGLIAVVVFIFGYTKLLVSLFKPKALA